jgi:hypothetical protein
MRIRSARGGWIHKDQQQKRERHPVDQPDEGGRDLRNAFRDAVVPVLTGPAHDIDQGVLAPLAEARPF